MSKHHTEDYKISAVKYYLEVSNNLTETCSIYDCSRISLRRWVDRYLADNNIKRKSRRAISYKITKEQLDYALLLLKNNEQISMKELAKQVKDKYSNFNITPQHLGNVIRDNNITRKRTRHRHYPHTRYGKKTNLKQDLDNFYKKVDEYKLDKIISLDETSIQPSMIPSYSRCKLGRRCIVKTDDNYVFRKFTLLVAINNKKCVGYRLYKEGGMTKERFAKFINDFIKDKYKNNLIILDNAGSHNNKLVKDTITKTNNNFLYSIPYNPRTNCVEMFINQIKHYMKINTEKTLSFPDIENSVKNSISKVK